MLWTIGVLYTVIWLASPMTVSYLTYRLGRTAVSTGTSISYKMGKYVNGIYSDENNEKNKRYKDDWVCISHPMYAEPKSSQKTAGIRHTRRRRYSV